MTQPKVEAVSKAQEDLAGILQRFRAELVTKFGGMGDIGGALTYLEDVIDQIDSTLEDLEKDRQIEKDWPDWDREDDDGTID